VKPSLRFLLVGAFTLVGLLVGYGVIFCFYAAGLFGDGRFIPPLMWEKALRGTVMLGPFFAAFLLLGFLAWRRRWSAGPLPWATGAAGVLVVARRDAGILVPLDFAWILISLFVVSRSGRHKTEDGEDD
jgi:hypothetical protein